MSEGAVQVWPEGTEVIVHTNHTFLRMFDHKQGTVVRSYKPVSWCSEVLVEVKFSWCSADFKPEELEVIDDGDS